MLRIRKYSTKAFVYVPDIFGIWLEENYWKSLMELINEFPIIRFGRKVVFEGDKTNLKMVQVKNKNSDRDKWSQPTNK